MKYIFKNLCWVASAFFIILFVSTAMSKLTNREEFESILWQNTLINSKAQLVSWIVPLTELVIVILLAIPGLNKIGLYSATILMTIFTLYIVLMKMLLPVMPCYCGGIIKTMTWNQHLIFNSAFIIIGIVAIRGIKFGNSELQQQTQNISLQ